MKGFTLFTGGDGVGIAMKSLGVDVVGGIEYIDDIAQVARGNGMNVTTADILQCDPRDFPAMDWLHASPPCPNFSVAKSGATETENDFDLARKVAEWATVHKPRVFSLENVIAYRKSESWKLILNALHEAGYWVHVAHVNFADYGTPQTRKRMIARAVRGGFVPYLQPTHSKKAAEGLPRWIGWYEAIEDLIPTLPIVTKRGSCTFAPDYLPEVGHDKLEMIGKDEVWSWIIDSEESGASCEDTPECGGHFAPWQLKRLPDEFRQSWMCEVANGTGGSDRDGDQPAATMLAGGGGRVYRAFVMNEGNPNGNEKRKYRNGEEPTKTVTAAGMVTRAFIVNESSSMEVRAESEPTASQVASSRNLNQRAFITDRLNSSATKPNRTEEQPAMTVCCYSPKHQAPNGYANGRVVKMTPRALARFQSFPDWYKLPESNTLATRIIGNAVPPVGMANVMRNLII